MCTHIILLLLCTVVGPAQSLSLIAKPASAPKTVALPRCASPVSLLRFFRKPSVKDAEETVACEVICEDDEPNPEAAAAAVTPPPEVAATGGGAAAALAGLLPQELPDRPKAADTALAGLGLFGSIALLGALEPIFDVKLFVPPMMASGIIFFAGPTPPDPRGFLSGTLCSATLSAFLLYTLDGYLPPVAADGASAGLLLVWYKTVGAIFPPAAVLAGTLTTAAASKAATMSPNDALAAGAAFLIFPWLTGHGGLYLSSLAVSKVRAEARVAMTQNQLKDLSGLTDDKLFEVFDKFDTDRSGSLDADELKIALRIVLGADLSIEDCVKLVNSADRDGNGVVDFQEFCFVCRGQV